MKLWKVLSCGVVSALLLSLPVRTYGAGVDPGAVKAKAKVRKFQKDRERYVAANAALVKAIDDQARYCGCVGPMASRSKCESAKRSEINQKTIIRRIMTAPCDADLNGDHRIDVADATLFGQCMDPALAALNPKCKAVDFNEDGKVTLADAVTFTDFKIIFEATETVPQACEQ